MQQAVKDYNNRGPLIRTTILFGKRAPGIVDFAHQNKIDLIVLSSHKIDRRDPLSGWGTISYKVAFLAHCPVMMVK
jgi:nucleotide-binding universal stress UspA family protein